jgi:hypothetical protein
MSESESVHGRAMDSLGLNGTHSSRAMDSLGVNGTYNRSADTSSPHRGVDHGQMNGQMNGQNMSKSSSDGIQVRLRESAHNKAMDIMHNKGTDPALYRHSENRGSESASHKSPDVRGAENGGWVRSIDEPQYNQSNRHAHGRGQEGGAYRGVNGAGAYRDVDLPNRGGEGSYRVGENAHRGADSPQTQTQNQQTRGRRNADELVMMVKRDERDAVPRRDARDNDRDKDREREVTKEKELEDRAPVGDGSSRRVETGGDGSSKRVETGGDGSSKRQGEEGSQLVDTAVLRKYIESIPSDAQAQPFSVRRVLYLFVYV